MLLVNFDQKKGAANFGLNCDYFGQNCDTRTRIKKIATYNGHPEGCPYAHPSGCALEPGTSRRRVDVRPRRKENKSRPIMGAPKGHPYAHPEGVCINGLGALPSPYGPTLRGAHNGPSGLQKKKIRVGVCAGASGRASVRGIESAWGAHGASQINRAI